MITEEEKTEIINIAVEKMLLAIPEVVGNLMANHAALHKINAKFYKDHPEFREKKNVVQAVVEMIEGKNPLLQYEDILEKAVPEVTKRIEIMKTVDMDKAPAQIPRDFSGTDFSQNGEV